MEDKPLTESINKQYSKYGSLRTKEKESRIKLCNSEDPLKFLTRIDSSIEDAKARVQKSIDKSTISEDYESSCDHPPNLLTDNIDSFQDTIPMVNLDRIKINSNNDSNIHTTTSQTNLQQQEQKSSSHNKSA